MNRIAKLIILLSLVISFPLMTHAAAKTKAKPNEPKIFIKKDVLPGDVHVDFSIVSIPKYKKEVEELFDYAFTQIKKITETFSNANPKSELSKIAEAAGQEPVKVSPETLSLTKHAKEIAAWTKGAFDPVKGPGSYKDLKIKKKDSTIYLKKPGLHIELGEMLNGFLADLFIRAAHAANIENAFVKVNGVSRALGTATYGPWSIQITGYSDKKAKFGRRITISNYSAATVGGETPRPLVDPRTGNPVDSPLYSVTVVTKEAATSQGVANSVYVLGPKAGEDLIKKLGIRAILAFKDGSITQVGKW